MTPVLLLMDDEPATQHAFRRFFREPDVSLLTANFTQLHDSVSNRYGLKRAGLMRAQIMPPPTI